MLYFGVLFLLVGCTTYSSPESTVRAVFDNILNSNYDRALSYFVDINGNPLSQEAKQNMKSSMSTAKLSSYKITSVDSLEKSRPDLANVNAIFKDAKVVSVSFTEKDTKKTGDTSTILVKQDGSWKVILPPPPPPIPQSE